MNGGPVLIVPASERGRGGGHLGRCLALARDLRALGREARVFLPPDAGDFSGLFRAAAFDRSWLAARPEDEGWAFIVLDRFQTPPEEFERWSKLGPLVGIDEGGPRRDDFDFLIDILPGLPNRSKPNIADVGLQIFHPEARARPVRGRPVRGHPVRREISPVQVLVSFGQEDAAKLGPAAARALAAGSGGALDITLLAGALSLGESPPGVKTLGAIPNLAERLGEYGLVVTHYGITAFESLYAGTPVALVSPGAYHEKLAKAAGFYSAGRGERGAAKLSRLLSTGRGVNHGFLRNLETRRAALAARYRLDRKPPQSLAGLMSGFSPRSDRTCPVCGASGLRITRRQRDRGFRRCPACGVFSMIRLDPPPLEYEREYFFELYKKQYGKTYIEDFPNLSAMAKRRLGIIKSLLPAKSAAAGNPPALLDIGCAYGPFLAAAGNEGFSPAGIDPAADAVRYVRETFGIPVVQGFFPGAPLPNPGPFDVVSLWYVIEHFQNCVPVFARLRSILRPGGLLAFATPSCSGVSGRFSPGRFFAQSPADHWTIWSPVMCKKALAQAGFGVKKIIVSGHHPERFPLLGTFAKNRNSPLYGILLAASRLFRLGDTFEVYAEKLESEELP